MVTSAQFWDVASCKPLGPRIHFDPHPARQDKMMAGHKYGAGRSSAINGPTRLAPSGRTQRARFYVATIALMRLLTLTDLLLCFGLFAIGSFIACLGDPLWLFVLPLIVGAALPAVRATPHGTRDWSCDRDGDHRRCARAGDLVGQVFPPIHAVLTERPDSRGMLLPVALADSLSVVR